MSYILSHVNTTYSQCILICSSVNATYDINNATVLINAKRAETEGDYDTIAEDYIVPKVKLLIATTSNFVTHKRGYVMFSRLQL